ncbi:DUF4917 family protein [Bradyrhizobium barranii]|uniref:DUF4917 family protein n=1 Tax=Bradyrhizobium barranii TaxID=2992140 RepID=UPI0024BFE853|nr:DUF4917 family protein [Bradyrhizobium japonicum]
MHGALHLFDRQTEIIKYTWSKTDTAIVDQIRAALNENKYPLFVAEGTSESKMERIMHSAYLHKALRSFESCCSSSKNAIVIFGHSLAENDSHVLKCISGGGCANLLVGLYGDPTKKENMEAIGFISPGLDSIFHRFVLTRLAAVVRRCGPFIHDVT